MKQAEEKSLADRSPQQKRFRDDRKIPEGMVHLAAGRKPPVSAGNSAMITGLFGSDSPAHNLLAQGMEESSGTSQVSMSALFAIAADNQEGEKSWQP